MRTTFNALAGVTGFVLLATVLGACGDNQAVVTNDGMARNEPFVRVARDPVASTSGGLTKQGLNGDGGYEGIVDAANENFYLAINKNELGGRWFLSAYLTQWDPASNTPMTSMGTRVVTFKVQNGNLYVFDVTDGKKWSDSLDPEVVVEAYPIVKSYTPFNRLGNSSSYVLFDPTSGLNRFSFVSDQLADWYEVRFQVDLSYMKRFRKLADGVAFDQVFTGYSEVPARGIFGFSQPFRASGSLTVSLRRYQEGQGFVPTVMPTTPYYFGSQQRFVPNQPRVEQYANKWNIHPGMQPIQWSISREAEKMQQDPRYAGIDVVGAMQRGIEGWNQAFGFQVFQASLAAPDASPGDDDKNFLIVDRNPGAGLAFANWRENPNTGEIRGASVYFSSVFVDSALLDAPPEVDAGLPPDGGQVDGGFVVPGDGGFVPLPPTTDGGQRIPAPRASQLQARLSWDSVPDQTPCAYFPGLSTVAVPTGLTRREWVERIITHTVIHEVGHTLGLRHNFKGSLAADSVMDYLNDEDASQLVLPGAYDTDAVKYLYGINAAPPTQPFCTDEWRSWDPSCAIWDTTSDPLGQYYAPAWSRKIDETLASSGSSTITYGDEWSMLKYVRAGATPEERARAFDLAFGSIAPPMPANKVALGQYAPAWADLLTGMLLQNLYLDPAYYRGEITQNPPADDTVLQGKIIAVAKNVLINSDQHRNFESRRIAIDVLKEMQSYDAYHALVDARPSLVAERATYNAWGQAILDDLMRRLDSQTNPYFR